MEVLKPILNYEGLYEVSNTGKIKSLKKSIIMKPPTNNSGYKTIVLSKNGKKSGYLVHRIVAQHFIYNFDNKLDVNHIDGNKHNNKIGNLEMLTKKENTKHAINIGLLKVKGIQNPMSKLTEKEVLEILSFKKTGLSHQKIADRYNVSRRVIGKIFKGQLWGWLQEDAS